MRSSYNYLAATTHYRSNAYLLAHESCWCVCVAYMHSVIYRCIVESGGGLLGMWTSVERSRFWKWGFVVELRSLGFSFVYMSDCNVDCAADNATSHSLTSTPCDRVVECLVVQMVLRCMKSWGERSLGCEPVSWGHRFWYEGLLCELVRQEAYFRVRARSSCGADNEPRLTTRAWWPSLLIRREKLRVCLNGKQLLK